MTTTPQPTCAGCPGCGGPDCIERPEFVTPEQEAELRRLATTHEVRGYCPACGGTSLFLGDGGYVTCSRLDCPAPDAASTLLERDPRTTPEPDAQQQTPCALPAHGGYCDDPRTPGGTMCAYHERAAHEEHRQQLATALGADQLHGWDDLLNAARSIAKARYANLRRAEQAEDEVKRLGLMVDEYGTGARQLSDKLRAERDRADRAEAARESAAQSAATLLRGVTAVQALAARWDYVQNRKTAAADIRAALGGDQPTPDTPDADLGPCAVCGGRPVVYRKLDRSLICHDCVRCRCGQTPCARTGVNDPAVSSEAAAREGLITTHTYEGNGGPCTADFYGQTCGAPRDDHDLVPEPAPGCEHRSWTRTQMPGMDDLGITGPRVCDDCGVWIDRPTQPDAEPEHTCGNCEGVAPESCLNNSHRRGAAPEPEQPAEPELIPVLDYAIRRTWAAIRNTLKEHQ